MLNLYEIFSIIFIHWIADFVLQTHWEAVNKSKNNKALLKHTIKYTLFWYLCSSLFCAYQNHFGHKTMMDFNWTPWIVLFFPITFITHTITDYYTSRLNSKLWEKGDTHNFFVSVGFDQCLHYVQLFLTYYFLRTIK
jgi:hypothetical protein